MLDAENEGEVTPEFKKWVEEQESETNSEDWWCFPALGPSSAEFWVRQLFELIEEEAKSLALANSHGVPHDPNFVDYSEAIANIKSRFGITGRKSDKA